MRLTRHRRIAMLSTAVSSALGLSLLVGCDLDRSSLGVPMSAIDDPASAASDAGTDDRDALVSSDDAELPATSSSDVDAAASSPPVKVIPPGSCDLTGSFAIEFEAQVRWQGSTLFDFVPIITPGNGKLSVTVLAELTEQGDQRSAKFRACGASTPDFSSSVSETYGVAFPDEVWEKLALRWATPLTVPCIQPGCTLSAAPVVAQLGIDIPETAVWPTSRDPVDVSSLRDDDADGVPGILLRCRGPKDPGGTRYTHPPANLLLSQRVSEIMIAIRLGAQLEGKLDTCDSYSGSVPGMTIDTRALACALDSGARCDSDQLGFIDDNLPVWKVDSAKFKAVRVAPSASCTDARAAFP